MGVRVYLNSCSDPRRVSIAFVCSTNAFILFSFTKSTQKSSFRFCDWWSAESIPSPTFTWPMTSRPDFFRSFTKWSDSRFGIISFIKNNIPGRHASTDWSLIIWIQINILILQIYRLLSRVTHSNATLGQGYTHTRLQHFFWYPHWLQSNVQPPIYWYSNFHQ